MHVSSSVKKDSHSQNSPKHFSKELSEETESNTLQPENITYIKFCFWNSFPEKLHFSYKKYVSGIKFPKITLHVLVFDSET